MIKRFLIFIMIMLTINSLSARENDTDSMIASSDSIDVRLEKDELISRNLFVEFYGSSLGIGIGYDQRFKPNSVFGFSAGLSFTNGHSSNEGWFGHINDNFTRVDFKGVTIPLEVNAILGKRASKFELGIGATPCLLNRYEEYHIGWYSDDYYFETKKGTKLNIFGTLNMGYRLQRKSGFFMRIGLSFLLGDIQCSPIDGLIALPNLSLGYTIR